MKILKSLAVAFSMYSRIPMPRFNWASEDMEYHLIFFPWIGIVIGGIEYLWLILCGQFEIDRTAYALVSVAIPLLITGGFHVDGFMDTSDALSSWQDKAKRLEILKDPHIGAFAVIKLVTAVIILLAALIIMDKRNFIFWIVSFFIARILSGISVVKFKNAKKEGLLNTESKTANERVVFICLMAELIIGAAFMLYMSIITAICFFICIAALFAYYRWMSMDKFGGITGDLAGWFVTICEVVTAVAGAVLTVCGL